MAARKLYSIKLSDDEREAIRKFEQESGKTFKDVMLEGLKNQAEVLDMKNRIHALERQQAELKAKHEKMTGRKLELNRRVSFKVSDAEWEALEAASAESGKPKSAILREYATGKAHIEGRPALEVVS